MTTETQEAARGLVHIATAARLLGDAMKAGAMQLAREEPQVLATITSMQADAGLIDAMKAAMANAALAVLSERGHAVPAGAAPVKGSAS